MSDKFVAHVFPHIFINFFLIIMAFWAMNRRFFSRPHLLLLAGLTFMIIAASEKYMFGLLSKLLEQFVDLNPAFLFLEVSVAALGGNLVASAFLSKAQSQHNQWEKRQFEVFTQAHLRLLQHNRKLLAHRAKQAQMTVTDYAKGLDLILDQIDEEQKKIDRAQRALATDGNLS